MLCLGRKFGEAIIVQHAGETMRIVLEASRRRSENAMMTFDAPQSFEIVREEVKQRDKEPQHA